MKKTVYVIGAGASYEADLPTGDELKQIISNLLNDPRGSYGIDSKIYEALGAHVNGNHNAVIQRFTPIANHISNGLCTSISIDNYIDEHRDNKDIELCGKLAIVRAILEAERNSILYIGRKRPKYNHMNTEANISKTGIRLSDLENTWYIPFFKLLTEKCSKSELEERFRSITLIIFNYDRCVEHFIYCALQEKYFGMTSDEAANLVKSIDIYHPYGDIGKLPFYKDITGVEFGGEIFSSGLLELSRRIKTFTESTDSQEVDKIRDSIKNSNRLVFLGFAFHEINMKLIKPEFTDAQAHRSLPASYATGYKVSLSNRNKITSHISILYPGNNMVAPIVEDLTCAQLFADYSKSLSF